MEKHTLSKIFVDVYNNLSTVNNPKNIPKLLIEDYDILEHALQDYLVSIVGISIKNNYEEHYREIRKYFENIFNNVKFDVNSDVIQAIEKYGKEYNVKIDSHPYTKIFLEAMQRLYSRGYDGCVRFFDDYEISPGGGLLDKADTMVSNKGQSFIIGRITRKDEMDLPSIYIRDIDSFELSLNNYVSAVSKSDSYYNIFETDRMKEIPIKNKIRALFECTIFNATSKDLNFAERFFSKYTDFITDKTLESYRKLNYIGNMLDDDLYIMFKRSELEYETPFCLCFMLKNHVVELPNVRLGIENYNGKKIAHILATQTTQSSHINHENMGIVEKYIKSIIPTDSAFRFFNPSHLVSILMSFGILKGMGITEVEVADYLPFRHKKTVLDKQMNEEEATNFQRRLTDKNMITYMRLVSVTEGIKIMTYPEMEMGLKLDISGDIICNSKELQELYDMCYSFSKSIKEQELDDGRDLK